MARVGTYAADIRSLEEIADHHNDVVQALNDYYAAHPVPRFTAYHPEEIWAELNFRLEEQEKQSSLMVLAYLEARWRKDYGLRCRNKDKDPLSRHLRELKRTQGNRVSFEDYLLPAWVSFEVMPKNLSSEVRAAFKFRHWLAHGRYWEPDLGRRFDYSYIHQLAFLCQPYFKYD